MSLLVFALGVLLSLGGAISIYSGYGIVEVERGWTAVIAGATALSAGVVTVGIAFILRCLVRLQAFLEAEKGFLPLLSELALNQARHNLRQTGAEAVGVVPPAIAAAPIANAASPAQPEDPAEPEIFAMAARSFRAFPETSESAATQSPLTPPVRDITIDDIRQVVAVDSAGLSPRAGGPDATPDAIHGEAPAEAILDASPAVESSQEIIAATTAGKDQHKTDEAVSDASLQEDIAPRSEPSAAAESATVASSDNQTTNGELTEESTGEPEGPEITARYEAEGTSYIMYSDGSIDARSDRGSFHFQSLAELKAFMEAQS